MPATPAWPPESLPRLFIDTELAEGDDIAIDAAQANYLVRVVRLKAGAQVKLFDDRTGEWLAELVHIGKRDAVLSVEARLREREDVPDLWLCFAPGSIYIISTAWCSVDLQQAEGGIGGSDTCPRRRR